MSLPQQPLDPLTRREQDILRLLARGLSDQEIAQELVLSVGTVKWYNRQIYSKLGVAKRSLAVTQALQLGLIDLESRPAPSPSRPLHNLSAEVTSFVGRESELADLERLLPLARIVTLTGAPGAGKTRLALRAARHALPGYRDGVWFVSLAQVDEPDRVLSEIAATLGIEERAGRALPALVTEYLETRELLVVLDNFEHLLDGASRVGELVAAAPDLSLLVTSREALNLYGEYEYPLQPLSPPDLYTDLNRKAVRTNDAVQLFVQRAQAAAPDFALTDENAPAIATICAHLEGLPLAIELAAARVRLYSPQSLLVRLGSRLDILKDGPRDLPARQRTLRNTLAWSYDLLTPSEQGFFARLGIFNGSCSLESATAVCILDDETTAAEMLASLFNKNLLRQETDHNEKPRFWMLETLREYALERLDELGEREMLSQHHAEYFANFAEHANSRIFGQDQLQALAELDAEQANLNTALKWSLVTSQTAEISFRLVSNLFRYWGLRGQFREGLARLTQVLAKHTGFSHTKAYADTVYGVADLSYYVADYELSGRMFGQALELYRELRAEWEIAQSLMGLGNVATEIGDYAAAPALFEEAHTIMNALGDVRGKARSLAMLAWCALRPGDYELARQRLETALDLYRQISEPDGIALALSGLGEIAIRTGDLPAANELLEQSLALRRQVGDRWGTGTSLGSLGWTAMLAGDFFCAAGRLGESLVIRHQIGDSGGAAWCLEKLGELCHLKHRGRVAARLFGAAAMLRSDVNSVIDPTDIPHYEQTVAALRERLGAASFERAWAKGQTTSVGQVLAWLQVDES